MVYRDHVVFSAAIVALLASVLTLSAAAEPNVATASFYDCPQSDGCPEMIKIPASNGAVTLGSPESEPGRVDNEKQAQVTIPAFAIGALEVTVTEYLACADAKVCPEPEWRDPNSHHNVISGSSRYYKNLGDAITGADRPITGISWTDADAYTKWLSRKTGYTYRLPSEAEWEYAARAGTVTSRWWGNDPAPPGDKPGGHCLGCGSGTDGKGPAPARSLQPNPWGLYNVLGNVWEWVADTYCQDYTIRPSDGSARSADDCPTKEQNNLRVFRGGSTFFGPEKMRSASRLRNFASFRNFSVGFRVARNLP